MSLEADIVDWVKTRPSWQQAAFVRLCRGERFIDSEVSAIADRLVAGTIDAVPAIEPADIPGPAGSLTPVSLISVGDFANINALPAGEHLTFGLAGLTVVYGHNASGKSGYARLLKAVAAARHREEILGDVYETSRGPQRAVVRLSDGGAESESIWPGDPHPLLHQIAFYDEHCGDSYVSSEYEVSYRPSALTLLDDLIQLCGQVRNELDSRAIALGRTRQPVPAVPAGTTSAAFVESLSAATTTAALEETCTVEDDASEQLGQLLQEEARLRSSDPAKERARLTDTSASMTLLANHCGRLWEALGPDAQQTLDAQRQLAGELRAAAAVAASTTFDAEPVAGVGSNTWRTLWEAARSFSEQEAYHEHDFPVTGNDARCVLCHQQLDAAAADRLTRFQASMQDDTQQLAATAERDLEALKQAMGQIDPMGVRISEVLSTIPAAEAAPARLWIEHAGALKDRFLEAIRLDLPVRTRPRGRTIPRRRFGLGLRRRAHPLWRSMTHSSRPLCGPRLPRKMNFRAA